MGPHQSQKSIEPMTLGNMRANGVRSLAIRCGALWCNHEAILDAGKYPDEAAVPSFGPKMVCMTCGAIGAAEVRPNWHERAPACLFGTNSSNLS
jgi:hypothetical protein